MTDVRGTATWQRVEDHFRRAYAPAFGQVSQVLGLHATPDGRRIVLTGSVRDALEGVPRTVLATVADGTMQPITSGGGSASTGRFSPDGGMLAFLSDRAEVGLSQLYLLESEALGEAVAAPRVPGNVEYLSWSPDGSQILLGVAGFGADLAGSQGSGTSYRPESDEPSWLPYVDGGASDATGRSLWLYDVGTRVTRRLSPPALNVWEACWLGVDAMVAVTSTQPEESAWYTAVLTRIGLDGTTTQLATSEVQLGLPAATASGARLAVVQALCSDRWVVAGDLLVGTPDSLQRVDTAGVDVTSTQWIDEHRLGVLGVRGLETVAAVLDIERRSFTEVWAAGDRSFGYPYYPSGVFLADGRVLAAVEAYESPQQVTLLGPGSEEVLATVSHGGTDYLSSVNGVAEQLTWTASDGLVIEGILCRPDGPGPFPLVVDVHGGPVWAFRTLWSMGSIWPPLLVAQGYAVLCANPRGSGGRGQAFARLVAGDLGGDDARDVLAGVDAVVARGLVDESAVAVMGTSYGGYLSAWLVSQDHRFAAAVPMSPITDLLSNHLTSNAPQFETHFLGGDPDSVKDLYRERSPVTYAANVRTPCLTVAGARDRCTPEGQAVEFHRALREYGADSTLVVYPEEGHGVRAFPTVIDLCTRVLDFLSQALRRDPPEPSSSS